MTLFKLVVLAVLALLNIASAFANPFGGTSTGGSDFLPVEQAYQVDFQHTPDSLLINWAIADGYYLYKHKFKQEAYVNGEKYPLDSSYLPGKIHYDEYLEKEVESYYQSTQITANAADLPNEFILKIQSQGCADAGLCYAPRTQYFEINKAFGTAVETDKTAITSISGSSGSGGGGDALSNSNSLDQATSGGASTFLLYVMFAIVGGLILNLMPCVFPVLSLKALSFAASSGSPHSHHLHGWAYTAGVIGSFLIAAILILVAKTAGEQTGWGFQLQYPPFVAAMAYLFLVMGLSLSGMVYFGTGLMGVGQKLTTQGGYKGSFFTGVLAALVASPCTGPMMAPALGFALTQPPALALVIFAALGFGMALPFLLLSYSPKLAHMLPQPGAWMERLKELLAFPMYLTAVWLLFVFGRQVGMTGAGWLLAGAVGITFAIWIFKNLPSSPKFRYFAQATAIGSLLLTAIPLVNGEKYREAEQSNPWKPFSKELVHELRSNGQPVLVDFTADWCITCKMNKRVALSREGFMQAVDNHNVALVVGDWTNQDPKISEILTEFKRSGVPLYLVYSSDTSQPPQVLPQLLTQDMVIQAIERASAMNTAVKYNN